MDKNFTRAGRYFIFSIWIQSQLSDLIILSRHPRIIKKFIDNPQKIPLILRNERMKFWQKDFGEVKKVFEQEFRKDLSSQAKTDLSTIYYIRNAIGHSYVSLSRNYLMYKPSSRKKANDFKKAMNVIKPNDVVARPIIYKLDFSNDEIYFHNFEAIKRLDEIHLKNIANKIRIPHSRIR